MLFYTCYYVKFVFCFFKLNFDKLNVFPKELAFERSEDDPPEIEINGDGVNPFRAPHEGTSKDALFES